MFTVYGLYGDKCGLFYIGKTSEKRLEKRLVEHRCRANKKDNQKIYNKIRKLIRTNESFTIKAIQAFETEPLAHQKEIELIKFHGIKTRKGGILYNATKGGEGVVGLKHSPETRKKMSIAKMGNKINLGRHRPDMIERFSKEIGMFELNGTLIKRYQSHREAAKDTGIHFGTISDLLLGKKRTTKWKIGNRWVRFSESSKNLKPIQRTTSKSIPVIQYDINGNLIQRYRDSKHASKETGINDLSIREASIGKQKTAGGFVWKRLDKETNLS